MNIPLESTCFLRDATAIPSCALPSAWDPGCGNLAKLRRQERWPTSTVIFFVGQKKRMQTIVQATSYDQNHLHIHHTFRLLCIKCTRRREMYGRENKTL